jgi:hypothetical protein
MAWGMGALCAMADELKRLMVETDQWLDSDYHVVVAALDHWFETEWPKVVAESDQWVSQFLTSDVGPT